MKPDETSVSRKALDEAVALLAKELRAARETAKKTQAELRHPDTDKCFGGSRISQVENGFKKPNADIVEAYIHQCNGDRRRLSQLFHQVSELTTACGRKSGRKQTPVTNAEDTLAGGAVLKSLNKAFTTVDRETLYVINEFGVAEKATCIRKVRAVEPDARIFWCTYGYPGQAPGSITPEMGHGGTIVELTETESGYCKVAVDLGRSLDRLDPVPHEFSLRWLLKSSSMPAQLRQIISIPVTRLALRVEFLDPFLPKLVSHFRGTSLFDVESVSVDKQLAFSPIGFYSYEFYDLTPGERCGINWK